MITLFCYICYKNYNVKPYLKNKSKYCSIECKNKGMLGKPAHNKKPKISVICKKCGIEYFVNPCFEKTTKYCSKSCHAKGTLVIATRTKERYEKIAKAIKGIKRSKETIDKIRIAKTGIKQSLEQINKRVSKNIGQKRTTEFREKRSAEKSYLWKGGITPINKKIRSSLEYKQWRTSVFTRDCFTCVLCKKTGGELNADHILPFSLFIDKRFDIHNGRTLCKTCHKSTPTYGKSIKKYIKDNNLISSQ